MLHNVTALLFPCSVVPLVLFYVGLNITILYASVHFCQYWLTIGNMCCIDVLAPPNKYKNGHLHCRAKTVSKLLTENNHESILQEPGISGILKPT